VDHSTFEARLRTAAQQAVEFARLHVHQQLPDEVAFHVYPNQSYDGNPRVGDEEVFPEDSLPEGGYHGPWSARQVVSFLWRDEKVPEWIDIAVEAEDGARTLVGLRCCGRFTAQEELLYHRYPGSVPPFAIKSPALPPGWESVEASGKFDLYWRDELARPKTGLKRTAARLRSLVACWFTGRRDR
jgi:hypothetical protein